MTGELEEGMTVERFKQPLQAPTQACLDAAPRVARVAPTPALPEAPPQPASPPVAQALQPQPRGHVRTAIGLLLAGMACFAISDALAKHLAPRVAVPELVWFRYVLLALTIVPLLARNRALLHSPRKLFQVGRCMGMLGAALLFVAALGVMPLAEATAIAFASPTFTTALSALLLKERVDGWRWFIVLAGLGGVLVVMQPGTAAFQPAGLLALASALCWAVAVMFTRKVAETDSVRTTMAYSALVGLLATSVVAWPSLRWPAQADWLPLLGMACAWCGAQWLVVTAYQRMNASVLAPFAYAQLLFAALLGLVWFGYWPSLHAVLGMAIILACGVAAAWRARA
ncbi:hypothetical protein CCO03_09175 [Comamonas serinivorans]|uniref:EamA domain-containing protein n=1 Tax=Comamonas serinivorans TaxID=1082851 RepID=A0A1Y0EN25_9BURK|nr:DMT family transporter [Comamonas serinivorans]ARU04828.1 hypothetical protein CCO03_09175 [Comamonas serinivorans]